MLIAFDIEKNKGNALFWSVNIALLTYRNLQLTIVLESCFGVIISRVRKHDFFQ